MVLVVKGASVIITIHEVIEYFSSKDIGPVKKMLRKDS
jgi:hypothetical protein